MSGPVVMGINGEGERKWLNEVRVVSRKSYDCECSAVILKVIVEVLPIGTEQLVSNSGFFCHNHRLFRFGQTVFQRNHADWE